MFIVEPGPCHGTRFPLKFEVGTLKSICAIKLNSNSKLSFSLLFENVDVGDWRVSAQVHWVHIPVNDEINFVLSSVIIFVAWELELNSIPNYLGAAVRTVRHNSINLNFVPG